MMVDFWAVNGTGLELLDSYLSYGELFRPDYPDRRPFDTVKAYAKETNLTYAKQIELTDLDHNGTYCLVLINFYDDTQNVTVTLEVRYLGSPDTLLEFNMVNATILSVTFIVGVYLTATSSRRAPRRARMRAFQSEIKYMIMSPTPATIKASPKKA
jgi:hypothetical protein